MEVSPFHLQAQVVFLVVAVPPRFLVDCLVVVLFSVKDIPTSIRQKTLLIVIYHIQILSFYNEKIYHIIYTDYDKNYSLIQKYRKYQIQTNVLLKTG